MVSNITFACCHLKKKNSLTSMSGKMDNGHGGFKTAEDGKPYTTLLYADGPGFSVDTQGHRADITNVDTSKTGAFCVNNFI